MNSYIGLDIGTSAVKAVKLGANGIDATAERNYPVSYPKPGYSEQSPADWVSAAIEAIRELTAKCGGSDIKAISFSGQMHGLCMLDENDDIIRPAILWNDGRSSEETDFLNNETGKDFLLENTGNIAFAGFTAPKILWVKKHEPLAFARAKKICLPKDFVAYKFSGCFATDCSDAAGTLYFDTKKRRWSDSMLKLLGISVEMLPEVHESSDIIGTLLPEIAKKTGLCEDVKVIIGAGDNAASAIGTGTVNDGDCNISLGTSGTVFVCSRKFNCDRKNAIHSFCSANGVYNYLACILSAASCQKWWIEDILRADYDFEPLKKYAANSSVLFLPYLMGERSPVNDTAVRGMFTGLSADTTKEEMTVAVLEGVAFALRENIELIRSLGVNITSSRVCGGGARNKLWLQILADTLSIELLVPENEHGGAAGAAMLAAKAVADEDEYAALCEKLYKIKTKILPSTDSKEYYDKKYSAYLKLYSAAKSIYGE